MGEMAGVKKKEKGRKGLSHKGEKVGKEISSDRRKKNGNGGESKERKGTESGREDRMEDAKGDRRCLK